MPFLPILLTILLQALPAIGQESDSLLLLTPEQADSLEFRLKHHYTNNFNFRVKADTLLLVPRDNELTDTCIVTYGDLIAVALIKEQNDTVWVKLARDQITMGWVNEADLLRSTTPDDGISVIIDRLTGTRAIWMSALLALGLIAFMFYTRKRSTRSRRLADRTSQSGSDTPEAAALAFGEPEAPLLLATTLAIAVIYTGIQTYAPEFWQEYYFHPTLNPLILPGIMAVLLSLVWLLVVVYVALIIAVYRDYYFAPGLRFILRITGLAMLFYLLVSLSSTLVSWWLALVIAIVLAVLVLYIYFRHLRHRYQCPYCGAVLHDKGTCPECGTELK